MAVVHTTATPTTLTPTAGARRWHAATLVLVGLTMGIEFAHVLELVPKLAYPPELYVQLQNSLYVGYGTVGALIYVAAIPATGVLAWLLRHRRATLNLTRSALALQAAALATFLTLIAPVNARLRALAPGEVPQDFSALRDQWEFTHALGFVLFAAAFLLLLAALLREADR